MLCMIVMVISCRHAPMPLVIPEISITPASATIYSNDSIRFTAAVKYSSDEARWNISSAIGTIDATGLYIAPETITTDNIDLLIQVNLAGDPSVKAAAKLRVINDTSLMVSYSRQIQPVFTGNCNYKGCHGNGSKAAAVELSNHTNAVKHVIPFYPLRSILYRSVTEPDITQVMPPAGPLHAPTVTLIRKWIEQGALNN